MLNVSQSEIRKTTNATQRARCCCSDCDQLRAMAIVVTLIYYYIAWHGTKTKKRTSSFSCYFSQAFVPINQYLIKYKANRSIEQQQQRKSIKKWTNDDDDSSGRWTDADL
jgi:hypothetical protein